METASKAHEAAHEAALMPAYPRPQIPSQPVLSLASLRERDSLHIPSVLDAGSVKFASSGRTAIGLALRQMNIGKNDKVLVPAFHCSSMLEPILWVGAIPVFYKVLPDTSIDLHDVLSKLDGATKLLTAVNYFGFPQPLSKIRSFCDEQNLLFLEDCAHCFFGEVDGRPVGSFGHYAIASSTKFFPIYDGGCLISSCHQLNDVELHSAGPSFELKAALNALEKGFQYGRMKLLSTLLYVPIGLKNLVWGKIKEHAPAKRTPLGPIAADGGFGFDPRWVNKRSSFFSRQLLKLISKSRIATKRRDNYMKLHRALSDLPGCRPLFPSLPRDVVPWVFPLIADEPEKVFPFMKNAGVPITRFGEFLWPGVDEHVCRVSVDLSRRVLQFPCHQELLDSELSWMVEKIKAAFLLDGSQKK